MNLWDNKEKYFRHKNGYISELMKQKVKQLFIYVPNQGHSLVMHFLEINEKKET